PLVQINPRMGNVAEPDTRHFLHKDVYTHVTYADLETIEEKKEEKNEYETSRSISLKVGDTISSSNSLIVLEGFNTNVDKQKYGIGDSSLAVEAIFKLYDIDKKSYAAKPIYVINHNQVEPIEAEVKELGVKLNFWKITPETGKIEITLAEKQSNKPDFIVMEAIVFPCINILWTGCIVMIIGTALAIYQRIKRVE
ncbi:MAG: hypothetical protein IT235_03945, partial [Bacteroidia bacterium]|nr:hypothetical protein [Bacteroidia bacterium]